MFKPIEPIDELDRWIYGAKNIGLVVDLDERQAFYGLERGYIDGDKYGGRWRSTKRRLLKLAAVPIETPPPRQRPEHEQVTAGSVVAAE
jgi:hypothetical protein